MATKKKKVKLTKNDIGGSEKNILHSIKHIRANENKVIAVLVVIFIIIFGIIGYFTLTVDSTNLVFNSKKIADNLGVSVSTSVVTLDDDDVMNDENGLKTTPISLSINNQMSNVYSYQLRFVEDDYLKKVCDCKNEIDKKYIHYSLDGLTVRSFSDDSMLLDINSVESFTGKDINVRIWISDEITLDEDTHFHGRFIVEPCSFKENS